MKKIVRKPGEISFICSFFLEGLFLFGPFCGVCFSFVWLSIIQSLSFLESTEFTCRKLETGLASCQLTRTPKFPIFPVQTQEFNGIKGAKYITKTETDSEGDEYTVHFVVFQKLGGEQEVSMHVELAQSVAAYVNNFLQSSEQTFTITEEKNFLFSFLFLIVSLPFLFISIIILCGTLFVEELSINRNLGQVTHLRLGIPYFKRTYRFSEIQAVKIHTIELENSSDYRVQVQILPSQGKTIDFDATSDRNTALELRQEIGNLIGCQQIEGDENKGREQVGG